MRAPDGGQGTKNENDCGKLRLCSGRGSLKSVRGRQRDVGGGGSKWDISKDLGNGVAGEIDGSRKRKEEQKQQGGAVNPGSSQVYAQQNMLRRKEADRAGIAESQQDGRRGGLVG